MSLFPHNQWWRRHRRAFWQYFLPDAIPNYLPSQQKAFFLPTRGGAFAVQDKAVPTPGPGEVLVKTHAAALNPVDWKIQAYSVDFLQYPTVLGSDGAGTVEALGEGVGNLKIGDRVYVFRVRLPSSSL